MEKFISELSTIVCGFEARGNPLFPTKTQFSFVASLKNSALYKVPFLIVSVPLRPPCKFARNGSQIPIFSKTQYLAAPSIIDLSRSQKGITVVPFRWIFYLTTSAESLCLYKKLCCGKLLGYSG